MCLVHLIYVSLDNFFYSHYLKAYINRKYVNINLLSLRIHPFEIFVITQLKSNLSLQQLTVYRQGISSPFDCVGINSEAICPA